MYKPFIKWAGGKRQLLPEIIRRLPVKELMSGKMSYAEPFIGGGAVFFRLLNEGFCFHRIYLNDLNARLMTAYRIVRDEPMKLISRLRTLESEYQRHSSDKKKECYLFQRKKFNSGGLSDVEQAALLIFLNRTCFNGLYRENSKGHFNVPFGKSENPQICADDVLTADALALKDATLMCGDFSLVLNELGGQTLFYLDPPYKPISETSSFNTYTSVPFDDAEQIRLRDFCRTLDRQGHKFILSNSDPGNRFFDELYEGFRVARVKAKRSVNANASKRGVLDELLISNV